MNIRKNLLMAISLLFVILFADGLVLLDVLKKSPAEQDNEVPDVEKTRVISDARETPEEKPVNFLILGVDEEGVRTDVIALMNLNTADGKLNILSIARDTQVRAKGRVVKINALAAMGGERLLIGKIEELTGIPVNYYVTINFKGFRKIIDILGGVEINVPFNMDYDDPFQNLHIHLKKGKQVLNGKKAEQFVRYRKGNREDQGYSNGDIGRIKAQQVFLKALIEQKVRLKYLSKAAEIFLTLKKYMKTNVEVGDVNHYLATVGNIRMEDIKAYTIPGDTVYEGGAWYFLHDKAKTKELIETSFFR